MDDEGCDILEGFGTCEQVTSQKLEKATYLQWADLLVEAVFNDPQLDSLQVTCIISAIKELGFPDVYAKKILGLEQQLDPKNEGRTVDKVTLRLIVEKWLKSCGEDKYGEASYGVNENKSRVSPEIQAGSSVEVYYRKEGSFKTEISFLRTQLDAYEDKIKKLQVERSVMKKMLKQLQVTLQKAEVDKIAAEEGKVCAEEALQMDKLDRSTEVSDLEKQIALINMRLQNLAAENDELSAKNMNYECNIKDLRDELVMKCDLIEEAVQENTALKTCLEQFEIKLDQVEKQNTQLVNENLELIECGAEWKETIRVLKQEKDTLNKRLLVLLSQVSKGEALSNAGSDGESNSSNIGDVSIFSPACFSSPLAQEKLSSEIAECNSFVTTAGMTPKICFSSSVSVPWGHQTEGAPKTIHTERGACKRKLFSIPVLDSLRATKKCRLVDLVPATTVALCRTEVLPLEHSTSFAVNLSTPQKLQEVLKYTLRMHPHLRGCIREFISLNVSNEISTKLLTTGLSSLYYEYCTLQLRIPFCGRRLLQAVIEELPSQPSSSNARDARERNDAHLDLLNSYDAVSSEVLHIDNSQHHSGIFQLENESCSSAHLVIRPPLFPHSDALQSENFGETGYDLLNNEIAATSEISSGDLHGYKNCVSDLENGSASLADLAIQPPIISGDETFGRNSSTGANLDNLINEGIHISKVFLHEGTHKNNNHVSEPRNNTSSSTKVVAEVTSDCENNPLRSVNSHKSDYDFTNYEYAVRCEVSSEKPHVPNNDISELENKFRISADHVIQPPHFCDVTADKSEDCIESDYDFLNCEDVVLSRVLPENTHKCNIPELENHSSSANPVIKRQSISYARAVGSDNCHEADCKILSNEGATSIENYDEAIYDFLTLNDRTYSGMSIEPSYGMYNADISQLHYSSTSTDLATPSPLNCSNGSLEGDHDKDISDPSSFIVLPTGCAAKLLSNERYRALSANLPVEEFMAYDNNDVLPDEQNGEDIDIPEDSAMKKLPNKMSYQPVCRCRTYMILSVTLIICSLFLFFLYNFLGKVMLSDYEYQTVLMSLGAKYHPPRNVPY